MAIAFDAAVEANRTSGSANPFTWVHTPSGTPRGVLVVAIQGNSDTDLITALTYGGEPMTRVRTDAITTGEPGRVYIYFLGSAVPTGAQSIQLTITGGSTESINLTSVTFTATGDTEIVDHDGTNGFIADPSVVLSYAGRTSLSVFGVHSGQPNITDITSLGTATRLSDHDWGNRVAAVDRQSAAGSADYTAGFTIFTDDVAFSAAAVTESAVAFTKSDSATLSGETVVVNTGAAAGTVVVADAGTGDDAYSAVDTGSVEAGVVNDVIATDVNLVADAAVAADSAVVNATSGTLAISVSDGAVLIERPAIVQAVATTVPTLVCRIDWDNDGDFSDALENLTGRVLDAEWERGRSADFSTEAIGRATLVLDNFDDRYTPEAPVGGLTSDQIVPGRPVHIYASFLGLDRPKFFGYIERITPNYADRTVTITCYDPLRRYQETDAVVPASALIQRSARDFRVAILDDYERGTRNLVTNPSFETNTDGWDSTSYGGGTLTRITTDAAPGGGSASAEYVTTGANQRVLYSLRSQPLFLAGQVYRLSFYARSPNWPSEASIWTFGLGNDFVSAFVERQVTVDATWRRYTLTFRLASNVAPADLVSLALYVKSMGAGTIRIDNVAVTRGEALHPYAAVGSGRWPNWVGNGSFDGGTLNGWYGAWKNMIGNPSFETDTSGWLTTADGVFLSSGASFSRVTTDPLFGVGRGEIDNMSQLTGIRYAITGTFKAGVKYLFSCYVKAPSAGAPWLFQLCIGSAGTATDRVVLTPPSGQGSLATWYRFASTWTPTADRTDAQIAFRTLTITQDVQVDGFMVAPMDPTQTAYPAYSDTGPGGGAIGQIDYAISTVAKYGSLSQAVTLDGVAGRVYDFAHAGSYFEAARTYSVSLWLNPSADMPYKVGIGASKGDGTWDEASATGTAPADAWTRVTLPWTPSANRSAVTPFDVILYVYQTDSAPGRLVRLDGVRVIPDATVDDFEMSHWQLDPEPDVYSTTASLSGSGLSALARLNELTLTRHWIEPILTAPFYRYVTRSRDSLVSKVVEETWIEDVTDVSGFDIDRASIVNIVSISWANGNDVYSDEDSIAKYGPRPGPTIAGEQFFSSRQYPDIIGPALVERGKDPRGRPIVTRVNLWPSQLDRDLDDLVEVVFQRLKITNRRYLVMRITEHVSESGQRWESRYALEEHAF